MKRRLAKKIARSFFPEIFNPVRVHYISAQGELDSPYSVHQIREAWRALHRYDARQMKATRRKRARDFDAVMALINPTAYE